MVSSSTFQADFTKKKNDKIVYCLGNGWFELYELETVNAFYYFISNFFIFEKFLIRNQWKVRKKFKKKKKKTGRACTSRHVTIRCALFSLTHSCIVLHRAIVKLTKNSTFDDSVRRSVQWKRGRTMKKIFSERERSEGRNVIKFRSTFQFRIQ